MASCHDCSDGGLGVALAEAAFAGGLGLSVDLSRVPCSGIYRDDHLLFSETQSRFIVTVPPEHRDRFVETLKGNTFACAGQVLEDGSFRVNGIRGNRIIEDDIRVLKEIWQKPLRF